MQFSDTQETYILALENRAFYHIASEQVQGADATFTVAKTRNYPNITHYSARAFLVETLKEQKALS